MPSLEDRNAMKASRQAQRDADLLEEVKTAKKASMLFVKKSRAIEGITTSQGSYEMSYTMDFIDELRHRNDFSSTKAGNPSVAFRDKNGVFQPGQPSAITDQILEELETQMYADMDNYETRISDINDATAVEDVEAIVW